ncbi:MAG: F0F1 ATP synthase subunit A [Chloroflexia bacterium]|nr:F0F1 ATP synthase subunit A [Chloroflexia bacterium]
MEVHVEIAAETLFHLGPIPVTNAMVTMVGVMALILGVFTLVARRAQVVPGRGQGVVELIVDFLLGLVEGTAGKRNGRRVFPLIGGLFIFILASNLSGLIPGVGSIGVWHEEEAEEESAAAVVEPSTTEQTAQNQEGAADPAAAEGEAATAEGDEAGGHHEVLVPILRSPSADINMTLAMALITFTTVQFYGIKSHGFVGRIKHMADPPFLFPIELISELSRIISLSARLFGNVFAGEVLLAVMYAMAAAIRVAVIPLLFPVVFLFLELLFGTIQALVFALLTLVYIVLAFGEHDDHQEDHARHEGAREDIGPAERGGAVPAAAGD